MTFLNPKTFKLIVVHLKKKQVFLLFNRDFINLKRTFLLFNDWIPVKFLFLIVFVVLLFCCLVRLVRFVPPCSSLFLLVPPCSFLFVLFVLFNLVPPCSFLFLLVPSCSSSVLMLLVLLSFGNFNLSCDRLYLMTSQSYATAADFNVFEKPFLPLLVDKRK